MRIKEKLRNLASAQGWSEYGLLQILFNACESELSDQEKTKLFRFAKANADEENKVFNGEDETLD